MNYIRVGFDVCPRPYKFDIKQSVNCSREGRVVLAVMPACFGKSFSFQLFSTAIEQKKISEGKHQNSAV